MPNWEKIADLIFDLIDYGDEERPTIFPVTVNTAKYQGIDRTMFRDNSSRGYSDDLYIYMEGEKDYILYTLFHECWHAYDKKSGIINRYSQEDINKYVKKPHMMMLYKYEFEAKATGYSAAFVYELYKIATTLKTNNLGRDLADSYNCIENYPEDQFDSHIDYEEINKKIKKYYDEGKQYFENMMKRDVGKDLLELTHNRVPPEKLFCITTKGMILTQINSFLK